MTDKQTIVYTARAFATTAHDDAGTSYAGDSYSKHLKLVVKVASEYILSLPIQGHSDEVIAACWCHDLIEDAHLSYNDVQAIIGTFAADIVIDVTDEIGKNRKEKALKTYVKIRKSTFATFVKLCDRIANSEHSKHDSPDMFKMYKKEYVIFKYALKQGHTFGRMWERLDKCYNE